MIRLKDILGEDTKAAQQRRKKFRMMFEGGEVGFELDAKEFEELNDIAKKFGSDLSDMVELELQEKGKPSFLKMTSSELEEGGYVLKIDKSIFDGLDEIVDLGMVSKKWYAEMNDKIMSSLEESDGCLFLILLGIFASFSRLADNFKLASQVYVGLKKDLENPETEKQLMEMIEIPTTELYQRIKTKNEFKNLATVQGFIKGNKSVPTVLPNIMRTLKLYKQKGYKFTKAEVAAELGKHISPETGALADSKVISSEKICAFTLNLLDPEYKTESGWLPVTMDIWMATFFYPELSTEEKRKLLAKNANYVYLAKLTHELAAKYNMEPLEMQAVIWVGKIRKLKGDNYLSTFDQAIDQNLNKLQIKIEELKNSTKVFEEIIKMIGSKSLGI
jgi:hypothetical protein